MTSKELGILIISVIMHNIGMFIAEDGLNQIIYGISPDQKTDILDKYTWGKSGNNISI